ncbi:2Fe-2S iron-sulfur cluster-binding protein [Paucibacter sp. hw1]|uniref:2Fe-2S iron-sulfur cluster-binding protein n=2 Tax=Roseateles koreensis TaxID=2987526 RepID=A0ABT5KN99_9BURK|nr:2Fe-2S iron-sulfur cluster-binding protein [Roseateles koreensis]MDC8784317.1 2Fe-2S iron-sulfur cluster-binding protein [Roseateles koreensis]
MSEEFKAPLQVQIEGKYTARFSASPGEPLLQSALNAGVELPRSCRNGTCRACLCHLTLGLIEYRIDWPGLSREEKAEGCVLPCVALPRTDVVLRYD